MSKKLVVVLAILSILAMVAGCATPRPPPAPQVVEKPVVQTQIVEKPVVQTQVVTVKETVVAKETVVVEATPAAPAVEKSDVQELRVIELADWNSAFRINPLQFGSGGAAGLMWMRMAGINDKFEAVDTPMALAKSWEFSPDRTSVTIKLKEGIKFSDGSPITAKEAAWSLGYSIMTAHPDLNAKFSGSSAKRYFGSLKGAQDVFDGKIKADEFDAAMVEGIKVIDDATIQLDFTQPVMTLTVEPLQFWPIVKPESVMAGKGKEYGPDAYWTTEKDVVELGTVHARILLVGQRLHDGPEPELGRQEAGTEQDPRHADGGLLHRALGVRE